MNSRTFRINKERRMDIKKALIHEEVEEILENNPLQPVEYP
jgi:hypothetical protein